MAESTVTNRYERTFARLKERGEGAFVPFLVLGDPDPGTSRLLLRALVEGGADALELGIPFSDPIADGPTIQGAVVRAMAAGMRPQAAFGLIRQVRAEHPDIPIGLLVYANLVVHRGMETFYWEAAAAGVDSVLVADVPVCEAQPFVDACRSAGLDAVLIAPPNASDATLADVARMATGYTYVLSRAGVTGADAQVKLPPRALLERLQGLGAPPPLLGFGVSRPEHVRAALASGAAGAISGSAVVERVTRHLGDAGAMIDAVREFVREMKGATR